MLAFLCPTLCLGSHLLQLLSLDSSTHMVLNAFSTHITPSAYTHPGPLLCTHELISKCLLDISMWISNNHHNLNMPQKKILDFLSQIYSSIVNHISEWFHRPTSGSHQKSRSWPWLFLFPSCLLASPISPTPKLHFLSVFMVTVLLSPKDQGFSIFNVNVNYLRIL